VLSKIWIVALFALYQALVWTGLHFLIVNVPGGLTTLINFYITLALVALVGGILGLLASALARSVGGAALLVFIFVLPQFLFSGGLRQIQDTGPVLSALNWINPSRHAFEALVTAGGHGLALWSDGCLNQPEDVRSTLSEDQKGSPAAAWAPVSLQNAVSPASAGFMFPNWTLKPLYLRLHSRN
jgi:hypothetical protein